MPYTNQAANPFLVENNEEGRLFIRMLRKNLANGHSIRVRYRGPRGSYSDTRASNATHLAVYIYHTIPGQETVTLSYHRNQTDRNLQREITRLRQDIDQLTKNKIERR